MVKVPRVSEVGVIPTLSRNCKGALRVPKPGRLTRGDVKTALEVKGGRSDITIRRSFHTRPKGDIQ